MAIPNINDFDERIGEVTRDYLGETIEYKADGGSYADTGAHVDYGDTDRSLGSAQVIAQDISVSVLKADVPIKPGRDCRVKLAKRAGIIFRPINVGTSNSGLDWEFALETVSD